MLFISKHHNKDRQRMITLYQFPPAFGLANASPFCMKVEAYCALAKIDYQNKYTTSSSKMPLGKLPSAHINGQLIADSSLIINELEKQFKIEDTLTPNGHAHGYLLQILCEEQLYWALVYSRWLDDDFWPITEQTFFAKMPLLLRLIVPKLLRKRAWKNLHGQGMGRHTKQTIYGNAIIAIEHLSELLGEQDYFVSNNMTKYDCAIYPVLSNILNGNLASPLQAGVAKHDNLVSYIARCNQTCGI